MAISYTEGNHRDWAASIIEGWYAAQIDALKGNLSQSDREGIQSGVERTDELIKKLRNSKIKLTHSEWDDVMMYIWQETCE